MELIGIRIIAILAVIALVFNSFVLYSDVRYLKKAVCNILKEIKYLKNLLIERDEQCEKDD